MRVYAEDSLTGGRYLRRPRKRGPRRRRRSPLRAVVRGAALVGATWIGLSLVAVTALRFVAPPSSMVMWLEPGPLAAIDYRWTDRSGIAVTAAQAVIAAEDQKFLAHRGFDLEQIDRAIAEYRDGERLRGASTITQQVAKNLFLWNGRSFVRKGLEAWFALLLELLWPKERILEVYLNIAEFGPGVFGVEAAAGLVGAQPAEMTGRQAATLAAVLPNPKRLHADAPSDYVRMRRDEIERQMRLLEERGHYAALDW